MRGVCVWVVCVCVWWVCVLWCVAYNVCRMLSVCVVCVCVFWCGVVCVWYGVCVCEMGVCEVGLCVWRVCIVCECVGCVFLWGWLCVYGVRLLGVFGGVFVCVVY